MGIQKVVATFAVEYFGKVIVFGKIYWRQDLSNVKVFQEKTLDVFHESDDFSFFKLRKYLPNLSSVDDALYNNFIKIINLSNKSQIDNSDIIFILNFLISNKKSIFNLDMDVEINKNINSFEIRLYYKSSNKLNSSKNFSSIFELLFAKVCEVFLPINYRYNIKIIGES